MPDHSGSEPARPERSGRPMIEIRGVTRSYGAIKALDDANLSINEGEFFSLLGPSGCGKTTLLRMIAGFDDPTSGTIAVDGQPMDGIAANRRPTNMVFQSYAIFPHLNVEQNVAYGLKRLKLEAGEEKRRVEEAHIPEIKVDPVDALRGALHQSFAETMSIDYEPPSELDRLLAGVHGPQVQELTELYRLLDSARHAAEERRVEEPGLELEL